MKSIPLFNGLFVLGIILLSNLKPALSQSTNGIGLRAGLNLPLSDEYKVGMGVEYIS